MQNNISEEKINKHTDSQYGTDNVNYTRRLTRCVQAIKALWAILMNIQKLDYLLIYHDDNESVKYLILKLREELEEETDYEKKKDIKDKLRSFEPDIKAKYAIFSEYILKIAEEAGSGIGFNNTFSYFYNGCFWEEITKEVTKEFCIIGAARTGIKDYLIKVIDQVEALYRQFSYSAIIPTPEYDKDTVKINLENGTFTIKGKEQYMADFNSEDMFKYQLPFEYNPDATAPKFMGFLNQVLPEKESQMILSEYIGYVLTRNLKLEKCLVLIGPGGNGKSVVFDIISALLGKANICSYTLSQLCNETGYFRSQLTNKLINYSSELGGKGCNPDTVKQLISNEPITARSPYKDAFQLYDYCKFMFNANLIPKDIEQTRAYYRRFIFLPFDVTIPEGQQDKNLAKKIIKDELSGIFNWVLEGLNRILENEKFTESPKAKEKLKQIQQDTNTVVEFMEENGYKPSQTEHEELKGLYEKYVSFCTDSGHYKTAKGEFTRRLEDAGFTVKRKATNNATWVHCEKVNEFLKKTAEEIEAERTQELDDLIRKMK